MLGSIDRFVKRNEVVHFGLVEKFWEQRKRDDFTPVQEVESDAGPHSLMNILLNMPTAANVMQDATFHRICRFLSLGKTQSMLYSFLTAIATTRSPRARTTAGVAATRPSWSDDDGLSVVVRSSSRRADVVVGRCVRKGVFLARAVRDERMRRTCRVVVGEGAKTAAEGADGTRKASGKTTTAGTATPKKTGKKITDDEKLRERADRRPTLHRDDITVRSNNSNTAEIIVIIT